MKNVILMTTAFSVLAILGCEKKQESPKESPKPAASNPPVAAKPAAPPAKPNAQEHKEGDGHDHGKGGHGEEHELGTVEIAGFQVRAVCHGEIVAGKDTDIDVFVTGGTGAPNAVRLWIGSEDGKGAMKMKATINKDEAHNHVAVPNPIPAGSKLWVEIEESGGKKTVGSYDLKT